MPTQYKSYTFITISYLFVACLSQIIVACGNDADNKQASAGGASGASGAVSGTGVNAAFGGGIGGTFVIRPAGGSSTGAVGGGGSGGASGEGGASGAETGAVSGTMVITISLRSPHKPSGIFSSRYECSLAILLW